MAGNAYYVRTTLIPLSWNFTNSLKEITNKPSLPSCPFPSYIYFLLINIHVPPPSSPSIIVPFWNIFNVSLWNFYLSKIVHIYIRILKMHTRHIHAILRTSLCQRQKREKKKKRRRRSTTNILYSFLREISNKSQRIITFLSLSLYLFLFLVKEPPSFFQAWKNFLRTIHAHKKIEVCGWDMAVELLDWR